MVATYSHWEESSAGQQSGGSLDSAVRESELLYAYINNPGHCNFLCDRSGVIQWASPGVEEALGYKPDSLIRVDVAHLFSGSGGERIAERIGDPDAPSNDGNVSTYQIHTANGTSLWVDVEVVQLSREGLPVILVRVRDVSNRVAGDDALRGSERRFRSIVSEAPFGLAVQDLDGHLVFMNSRLKQVMGTNANFMLFHGLSSYLHQGDIKDLRAKLANFPQSTAEGRLRFIRPDGEVRTCEVKITPQAGASGRPETFLWAVEDITARVRAEEDQARLYSLMEVSSDLVAVMDFDRKPLYLNPQARTFFAIPTTRELNADTSPLNLNIQPEGVFDEAMKKLVTHETWEGEVKIQNGAGDWIPFSAMLAPSEDEDGNLIRISAVLRDISERKGFEERLEWEATHDPLTQLPNRVFLTKKLIGAAERAHNTGTHYAVGFLDLDDFRVINESLGHDTGDRLLNQTAEKLQTLVGPQDTVARFGADEFAILLEGLSGEQDALDRTESIRTELSGTVGMAEVELRMTFSAGIACTDGSLGDSAGLLRDANSALHESKAKGRNRTTAFTGTLRRKALGRLNVETGIRRALRFNEFRLFFQPQISLETGRISGGEALIRWQHPEQGLMGPDKFIGIAEQTGLIQPIGSWVLKTAFEQMQAWRHTLPHQHNLTMGVNLSGKQLMRESLVDEIAGLLNSSGIDPALLELEITESILLDDVEGSIKMLEDLKGLGVKLALDDFGTGYSSLTYLQSFPIDIVKIDRSFVDGISSNKGNAAIVKSVIDLATTLELECIAEGVETHEDLATLRKLGCGIAQGFLIAQPLSMRDAEAMISYNPVW